METPAPSDDAGKVMPPRPESPAPKASEPVPRAEETPANASEQPPLKPVWIEEPPEPGMSRLLKRLPMYIFILFLGIAAADYFLPGTKVIVGNRGDTEIHDVTLTVYDSPQPLDPIAPGEEKWIRFRGRGEMPVILEYTDASGKHVKLEPRLYRFTLGDSEIHLAVKDGKIMAE